LDNIGSFLQDRVEALTKDQQIPIDLVKLAASVGAIVEAREMIPEAAMHASGDRYRIYIQSNFSGNVTLKNRQRFALAHEIAHTFFYENRDGQLKARKASPKGEKLEIACNRAASLILVPERFLTAELKKRALPPINARAAAALAADFEVSLEVMVRRLEDAEAFHHDEGLVLTKISKDGKLRIEYSVYPPWMGAHLTQPKRDTDFYEWFRPESNVVGTLQRNSGQGLLTATPVEISSSVCVFEIRYALPVPPDFSGELS